MQLEKKNNCCIKTKMGVSISKKELLEMFLRNKGNTFLVTNMEVQNNFVLSLFEVIVIVQTSL